MRELTRIRRSKIAALCAVPALVLLMAGCASVAGSGTEKADAAPMSDEEYSAAVDAFDLKVAQCLRDKGFDVKDPKPGEGILENLPGINEAGTACYEELGGRPSKGEEPPSDEETMKTMLKTAECLREKGYEVVDPTLKTGLQVPETVTQADLDICFAL